MVFDFGKLSEFLHESIDCLCGLPTSMTFTGLLCRKTFVRHTMLNKEIINNHTFFICFILKVGVRKIWIDQEDVYFKLALYNKKHLRKL